MKKAVQFGAGNIGRGFIGLLLEASGYQVTFADVNNDIINELNKNNKYNVKIMDTDCSEHTVQNVQAVNTSDKDIIDILRNAEVITTAVGVNILEKIANIFAMFISNKAKQNDIAYINIIACENAVNASTTFKGFIYNLLTKEEIEFANKYIGFVDCSVDRIVPPTKSENITDVVVEKYYEWNVKEGQFKGNIPNINGMNLVQELTAYVERKLFTLNTGHAICAYIGYKKGYATIDESINDKEIYNIVKSAMIESGNALIKKYKFDKKKHLEYIDKIIDRFKNPYLKDNVERVGREPLRKLGQNDRLLKPLNTAISYNLEADNLLKGISYALCFNSEEDKQSIEMNKQIKELGVKKFAIDVLQIKDEDIINKILKNYNLINNI